jgi:hypothetical protein
VAAVGADLLELAAALSEALSREGFVGLFIGPTLLAVGYSRMREWTGIEPAIVTKHSRARDVNEHRVRWRCRTQRRSGLVSGIEVTFSRRLVDLCIFVRRP